MSSILIHFVVLTVAVNRILWTELKA